MKLPRMALDEIVDKIVQERGLSRKRILELIEKKKSALGWMISDEGAADIVAKELGVETYPDLEDEDLSLNIADLVPGMSNVTITGRVTTVGQTREFDDKSGGKGLVANLVIADNSGQIRVALWGESARLIQDKKIPEGKIIRVHDAYVKEDLGERIELHVGRRGRIELSPLDVKEEAFPATCKKPMKIRDLTVNASDVNIAGIIKMIDAPRIIRTRDGREAKVSSITIGDETEATTRVVFWNDLTTLMKDVEIGDTVEIASGRARAGRNGNVEVHFDSSSKLKVSDRVKKNGVLTVSEIAKTSQKTPNLEFSIVGHISQEPQFRQFTGRDQTEGKVLSFILSDGASSIRIVTWGDNAEKSRGLRQGDQVRLMKVRLKYGATGQPEIHIGDFAQIEVQASKQNSGLEVHKQISRLGQAGERDRRVPRKKVSQLLDSEVAEIRGMITRILTRSPVYAACPSCYRKATEKEGRWLCLLHGYISKPTIRVLYSVILDDGSATISCTLSGKPGEDLLGIRLNEMPPYAKSNDEQLAATFQRILGMEIIFVGKLRRNPILGKSVFGVTNAIRPDPKEEARILLERINNNLTS